MKFADAAVTLYGTKSGPCAKCGKHIRREKRFDRTHVVGEVRKTREELLNEVRAQIAKWKAEPILHERCE